MDILVQENSENKVIEGRSMIYLPKVNGP